MKMIKIIFVCISILLLSTIALAQEERPKYNFGSMQPAKEFSVSTGDEIITKLYFYNIYGNRITHISLSAEAPENWKVEMEPALHNTTVSVGGILTTVTENLYVEPSNATDTIPADVPEGIEYISSSVGYIGAKPVTIKIKVPADEQVGRIVTVTINGVAEWLGQAGAAVRQGRSFDYTVRVIGEGFEEKIIEKPEKERVVPGLLRSKKQILNVTKEKVRWGLVGNEKLKIALEKALATPLNERAIENLARLSAEIAKDVNVTRGFSIKDNRSTLSLTIKNIGKPIGKFAIHDVLPKTFASSSDEITVSAPGASVDIIEKDPEYLFTYSELSPDQEVEISYTVDKEVSSVVIDEAEAALYAGTVEEVGIAVDYTWLGIVVVIIVVILVYFGFIKKKRKS